MPRSRAADCPDCTACTGGSVHQPAHSKAPTSSRPATVRHVEALRAADIADAISDIVTIERRVAVNEILIRADSQTW